MSITLIANAQIDSTRKIILGLANSGILANFKDPVTQEKYNFFGLHLGPSIGVCIKNKWVVGVIGEYAFVRSNYTEIEPFKVVGIYGRYYMNFDKRIKNTFIKERFLFHSELSFHKSNYYIEEAEVVLEDLSETLIRVNLGIAFKVWKGFYIEMTLRPVYQFNRYFDLTRRFSFEYHF
jgi:hypothetical protein